nr:ABC transporter ATP-binding protein [Mesorhizobium shangrilense]
MGFLRTANFNVSYGKIAAIRSMSIDMEPGRIVTIIGPNGAGKSTFLKALMGLLPFDGQAEFLGEPLQRHDVQYRVGKGMVLVPETRELFAQMSVRDNLLLGTFSRRRTGAASIREDFSRVFELFPRLAERASQIAGTLSGGERQMLALGRALMARPKLLMLDEPSLGLAPIVVREIFRVIAQLREMEVSILLVEQNARAALMTADHGYVLETGEVVLSGPAAELLHDPRIMRTYLGASAA